MPAPGGCTNGWDTSEAPSDYVLIDISRFTFPSIAALSPNSSLPAKLNVYKGESEKCRCEYKYANLRLNNLGYIIRVWIGNTASVRDRSSAEAIIASIAPRE